jgi:hypothetical protein
MLLVPQFSELALFGIFIFCLFKSCKKYDSDETTYSDDENTNSDDETTDSDDETTDSDDETTDSDDETTDSYVEKFRVINNQVLNNQVLNHIKSIKSINIS